MRTTGLPRVRAGEKKINTRTTPVERFAIAAIGMVVLTLIVVAGLTWMSAQQALHARDFVQHTLKVMAELGRAEAQLSRAEYMQRAYLAEQVSSFALERDAASAELLRQLDIVNELSVDLTADRLGTDLHAAVSERIQSYRTIQSRLESGVSMSPEERLTDGTDFRARISAQFAAITDEERRLLARRQIEEAEQINRARYAFVALIVTMLALASLMFLRLRTDMRARRLAESATEEERRYDAAHAMALTLFNARTDRQEALTATLALLGENPLFPVSAFYGHDELGGHLRLLASRSAPADIKSLLRHDDGPIGEAARSRTPMYLETFDRALGLRIETGLATLRPAALFICPVLHQSRLLGVLVLGTSTQLGGRERDFVLRLCSQLGVALHNLGQVESLNLLAAQLRESSEEVRQKNDQLERANRMKNEFVANMSHELRTPLNAVIGFSEILRDGLAGELNAEQTEYVGDIYSSGKHLLSLINDILDLSKVEAGHMALELAPALPAELVVAAVSVVREKASLRGIRVTEMVPADLKGLMLDSRKAKQILYNLVSNAVKFTPDGGSVTISIQRVPGSALLSARSADDTRVIPPPQRDDVAHWLEISVADTGIGVAPAALRELFQPFVQIDSSLSRRFEGTGLGLTMVKHLTELHGGGLMLHSTPTEGSTFTVWLPWRELQSTGAGAPTIESELPAAAAWRDPPPDAPLILVIEDDPRAASLMRAQLSPHGYRVEVAPNCETGLQRVTQLLPHVVVLDIMLPGMDGWDMLTRLKEQESTRNIPVVIASVTDEPQRGFALGAAQVLVKPVTQDDLLAALAAVGLQPHAGNGDVLVVDDDPKAVTLVCKHLQAAGFTPRSAYGGQQALDFVKQRRPDVIVLDLMMPQVSGFDVVEALAREPATANIAILVLTAKLVTASDREQLRGRVQRIMEKGQFQPESLLAEVRRALAKRRWSQ